MSYPQQTKHRKFTSHPSEALENLNAAIAMRASHLAKYCSHHSFQKYITIPNITTPQEFTLLSAE